ncbi:Sterol desaturase family protein [Sandaracinus amylolyticus]|uniref:Sterol desaturase family protein n=1 Tax=Sandaracinus amylolyticus TaxID=927083 RepID=A0A0F6W3J5_9BACT|nr:Sterol desaturase family protein [Sandaracinus amylolyticus]
MSLNDLIAARSYGELLIACFALCASLTVIGLVSGYAAERAAWKRGRKVFDVPLKRGQLRHEMIGTALFHLLFVPVLAGVLASGAMQFSSGWIAEIAGFFVPWYTFQLGYYAMHRAMHSKALFWMHRWHHESLVTTPMTGLSMHPAEAIGWIVMMLVPPVVLSHFGVLGAGGWLVFLAVHWSGNIAGHANAEIMPARSTRATTLLWSNPISYHSLHHARFDGHYGFVAATMDFLFGTEFPDWLAVHTRVFGGTPMKALKEKLAPKE